MSITLLCEIFSLEFVRIWSISVEELHVVRVACLIICSREYLWQNNLYWLTKLVLGMWFCIAWFSLRIYLPLWQRFILKSPGVKISFFCLTGHFCCWRNQIAVHLLQLKVLLVQYNPCFVHLSLEDFPISAIRKGLICRKSTFSHMFYSTFFFENTVMYYLLAPNTLEIQTDIIAKPTFQEVTQCHYTWTLYKI